MADQGVTPEAGREGWLLEIRYRWPKDRPIMAPPLISTEAPSPVTTTQG